MKGIPAINNNIDLSCYLMLETFVVKLRSIWKIAENDDCPVPAQISCLSMMKERDGKCKYLCHSVSTQQGARL